MGEIDDRRSGNKPETGDKDIKREIPGDRPQPGLQIVPPTNKDHGYPPMTPEQIKDALRKPPEKPMIN